MLWGIEFDMKATDRTLLANFPTPTVVDQFSTIDGLSENIRVAYILEYAPQSFKELQQLAGMKEQIANLLPSITFTQQMTYDSSIELSGTKWKLQELGKYFKEYIKFPNPLYPQGKDDFMSCLTKYAIKLHYGHRLYFESVLAIAIHFNSKCISLSYSRRELQKKSISIMQLDFSEQAQRLSEKQLKDAHSKGGKKRGAEISNAYYYRYEVVKGLLPEYEKENGKYDIAALVEFTRLSKRTIYNYIKRSKATAPL